MTPKEKRNKKERSKAKTLRAWVAGIKTKIGCIDCGYNAYAEALDFDHLGNKKMDISKLCAGRSSKRFILKEIRKCEVVCSNCHRHRTLIRGQHGREV